MLPFAMIGAQTRMIFLTVLQSAPSHDSAPIIQPSSIPQSTTFDPFHWCFDRWDSRRSKSFAITAYLPQERKNVRTQRALRIFLIAVKICTSIHQIVQDGCLGCLLVLSINPRKIYNSSAAHVLIRHWESSLREKCLGACAC